jgi:AAA family ATP:ADP antiporter
LPGALVAIPVFALVSFIALAAARSSPCLPRGKWSGGEERIAKPSREVLFTAVDAETKYKAKNFIDTVMQRGSDMVGVWLSSPCRPWASASSAIPGSARS